MNAQEVQAFVRVAAQLLDIPMAPDRCERVADHLGRTLQMARLLEDVPLHEHAELAELFVPAPFPAEEELP